MIDLKIDTEADTDTGPQLSCRAALEECETNVDLCASLRSVDNQQIRQLRITAKRLHVNCTHFCGQNSSSDRGDMCEKLCEDVSE